MHLRSLQFDVNNNCYLIPNDCKIRFGQGSISYNDLPFDRCFNFCFEQARDMNQWASRPGGKEKRTSFKMFCNTWHGKRGEEAVYRIATYLNYKISDIDYSRTELGVEDDGDLKINNTSYQIKSAHYFSNLFLIETANFNKTVNRYEKFILTRNSPSAEKILSQNDISDMDFLNNKQKIYDIMAKEIWITEIVGGANREDVLEAQKHSHLLRAGDKLGSSTIMDADNYYIVAGDLHKIKLKGEVK